MQYYRPTKLDCPVCGARYSIVFRYIELTNETESKCTICQSNWLEDGRLGDSGIRQEYDRNVLHDFYARDRRNRPRSQK